MKYLKLGLLILLLTIGMLGCQSDKVVNENMNVQDNVNVDVSVDEKTTDLEEVSYGDFKGYLWEVKGGKGTVYLFGSVHIAKASMYPFAEVVEKAFESSDYLGVEADISNVQDTLALSGEMMYETETVYDHLSAEGIEKYNSVCQELNMKPELFQRFRVWAAGSNLMAMQLMQSDYDPTAGIDMYFLDKASKSDKEIVELEGMRFQVDLMNSFTDEQQEMMFVTPLGTIEESLADFDVLYSNYLTGDVAKMTDYLMNNDEAGGDEALERAMLQDRNVGMAEKIDGYLQTGDSYFVVVGLAHYLGEESVIDNLEQMGYTVERK